MAAVLTRAILFVLGCFPPANTVPYPRLRPICHEDNQQMHAKARLLLRYKIDIDDDTYETFCSWITTGSERVRYLGPRKSGGTLHLIKYQGKDLFAVWDSTTHRIATFLEDSEFRLAQQAVNAGRASPKRSVLTKVKPPPPKPPKPAGKASKNAGRMGVLSAHAGTRR